MKLKELFEAKEKTVDDLGINYQFGALSLQGKNLTSLAGSPDKVEGTLRCQNNKLTSLVGGPMEVRNSYVCEHNELTSLEGAPKNIGGNFICDYNHLESLKHSPVNVEYDFYCRYNVLTSLEGAPKKIGRNFSCKMNKLTSLKGVHKIFDQINGFFDARDNPIESHVLGTLLIKGINHVLLDNQQVQDILSKHLGKGRVGMLQAQEELIEAGLEEFAQL